MLGCIIAGTRPLAADTPVNLTLDGRPISRKPDVAVMRNGQLFVDVVDLTRVFDGFLVFEPGQTVKIAIRGHTGTFVAGKLAARVDGKPVTLPEAPFLRNGDLYIPIGVILGRRTGISLAKLGPRRADLRVAAFAGASDGARASSSPTPALALAILPTATVAPDGLHVSVSVRNALDVPYVLTFPTSARAEFMVDRNGSTVWDSAQGKRFLQSFSSVTLAPDEAVSYSDVWTGWSTAGPGRYQLRARLMLKLPILSSPVSLGVVQ